MPTDASRAPARARGRVFAAVIALAIAIGLLGLGVLLTNSAGTARVSANARALHWTNATIGSAGIARASVAQAVFFAFDERLGVSTTAAKNAAIEEANRNLEAFETLLGSPDRTRDGQVLSGLESFLATAQGVIDAADQGEPDQAEEQRLNTLEPTFTLVEKALTIRQSELAQAIVDSEESAGRIALITEVAITFLMPAVTMVVFWWFIRRRSQVRELEMTTRLESEKRMSIAKDEFISGLSHELRTPLTTIHGFSEVLLQKQTMDLEDQEMLGIINDGSADLSRMVDDLIAAARIDDGSITWRSELIDLSKQVDAIAAPFMRTGSNIVVDVPPIEVYADPLHVRHIVRNLISNARRHGGKDIMITGRVSGGRAVLVVLDNGPAISDETEQQLFQRFLHEGKTALVAGSVGLGLAVSRELAMRMGGSVSYQRVDGWTTFRLSLPHYPGRESTHDGSVAETHTETVEMART